MNKIFILIIAMTITGCVMAKPHMHQSEPMEEEFDTHPEDEEYNHYE